MPDLTSPAPAETSPHRVAWTLWLASGVGILAIAFTMSRLARYFVWGDEAGRAARPILEVVALWLGGWLMYAAALQIGRRLPPRIGALAAILVVAALARGVFFGTNPIQEDDAYRYLWDGQQVLEGVNPYVHPPGDVVNSRIPENERLKILRAVLKDPAARENHRKINNREIPTVYPPVNMVVYAASQRLFPWKLDGLRAVFLLFELGTIVLLWFTLRAAGGNPLWCAAYAWCPLTIKEMANSPHHDAIVVFFLAAFLLCIVSEKFRLAAAALALATASKIYPAVLLPVLVVAVWRRDRAYGLAIAGTFAAVLVLAYMPFFHPSMFQGTGTFATEWGSNPGIFTFVQWGCDALFGRDNIDFFGRTLPRSNVAARIVVAAAVVFVTLAVAARARFARPPLAPAGRSWELPFRCYLVFAVAFALAPAQHPWYFAGILPFVCLFPYRSWILLTGLLGLYYVKFHIRYHYPEEVRDAKFDLVRLAEYAPFYLSLVTEAALGFFRQRAPTPPGDTLQSAPLPSP